MLTSRPSCCFVVGVDRPLHAREGRNSPNKMDRKVPGTLHLFASTLHGLAFRYAAIEIDDQQIVDQIKGPEET